MGNLKVNSVVALLVLSVAIHVTQAQEVVEMSFTDVGEKNRYHDAIESLYDEGIVEGYEDNTFNPYGQINRAEALKIILLSFDVDTTLSGESEQKNFGDVTADAWYTPYILRANQLNIVKGYDDGQFYPEKTINLAEALKMIIKTSGTFDEPYVPPTLETDPAADTPKDSWYADYSYYALVAGMVYVDAEGNLNADHEITRGELAELIYRMQHPGVYSGDVEFGQATYYGWSMDGTNTASGEIMYQADYSAAHKTLPFGTRVRVTHVDTGDTIVVRIIDRGPYGEGRVIDLSAGAFEALAPLSVGVINVEVEVMNPETGE